MMDDKLHAELAHLLTATLRDQSIHRRAAKVEERAELGSPAAPEPTRGIPREQRRGRGEWRFPA